jgi:hypothetical protein
MTLTHGVNGLYPCPVCLVPKNEQSDLMKSHPLCTAEDTQKICEDAKSMRTEADKENILKTRGIWLIEVWSFLFHFSKKSGLLKLFIDTTFCIVECLLECAIL